MDVDELRSIYLFQGLDDGQLAELAEVGDEVPIETGAVLFTEGDHADFWWVLLSGAIVLMRHVGREDTAVGMMDVPGRWAGGFRAWDDQGVYLATGRGAAPGRVFRVPSEALREKSNAWFPLGGHLIEGLYRTARSIESTARQRESLVALGTLAAGLAHEINNPAAATTRAADALDKTCTTLLASLGRLARDDITSAQFIALDELRLELEAPHPALSPMQLADREEALASWLGRAGVDRSWAIAAPLAAAGADTAWCARVAEAVGDDAVEPALEWVASAHSSMTLLAQVKDSTRRVSELVAAVRSYSQVDRGSRQNLDVTEGIESTLTMLGHKLKHGIEVVREYGADVPRIDAYPGELNQVWTNLIDNATDAMEGGGTLTVTTRAVEDGIVVDIADTGEGMPPAVMARAFEAFYTTKEVGKGTGLGLDIARRIVVERHGGLITIDSQPGSTVIHVRLPHQAPDWS